MMEERHGASSHAVCSCSLHDCTSGNCQNVTVGQLPAASLGTTNLPGATVETYIDLAHPATASGTLTKASVEWSRACAGNAFKILFIRPSFNFGSFTVVAQRGPFPAIAGRN